MDEPFEIFLSHYTEEESLAEEVQDFLGLTFGTDLRVFRSSDDGSIKTNEPQYQAIMQALKDSVVYIGLVSKYSAGRPWLNFEMGHGVGKGAAVFSLLVRITHPNDVPSTLSELQLRELARFSVIEELLSTIEQRTGRTRKDVDPQRLIERLRKREAALPARELSLCPFIEKSGEHSYLLRFEIIYQGPRPLSLVQVWGEIPMKLLEGTNWPWGTREIGGYLHFSRIQLGEVEYLRQEYIATEGTPPVRLTGMGWRPLHPVLMPNSEPQILKELRYAINAQELATTKGVVRGQIVTLDGPNAIKEFPLAQIERR